MIWISIVLTCLTITIFFILKKKREQYRIEIEKAMQEQRIKAHEQEQIQQYKQQLIDEEKQLIQDINTAYNNYLKEQERIKRQKFYEEEQKKLAQQKIYNDDGNVNINCPGIIPVPLKSFSFSDAIKCTATNDFSSLWTVLNTNKIKII